MYNTTSYYKKCSADGAACIIRVCTQGRTRGTMPYHRRIPDLIANSTACARAYAIGAYHSCVASSTAIPLGPTR
eukprot:706416-Rhodomonas_salina.1